MPYVTNSGLTVRPLSNALGAEISGIDITGDISQEQVDAIRSIWNQYHIILFRGVKWTPEEQIAFSRRFGPLDPHDATPFSRDEKHKELLVVTNRERNGKPSESRNTGRNWHSDYAYTGQPSAASMLYSVEMPEAGGDTMFCNMAAAYDDLSDKMKDIVGDLHSVYDFSLVAGLAQRTPEYVQEQLRLNPPVAHPTVRVHPDSGTKALYVSERASHFDGMTRAESLPLIEYLCAHATRPENVYRHSWLPGDMVCWDNRTTMHVALADFDPKEPRHMLRTTLQGEKSGYLVPGVLGAA